jgi:hypothetical protein
MTYDECWPAWVRDAEARNVWPKTVTGEQRRQLEDAWRRHDAHANPHSFANTMAIMAVEGGWRAVKK